MASPPQAVTDVILEVVAATSSSDGAGWANGIFVEGAAADGHAYAEQSSGPYLHRVLDGIGHNVPQEAPQAFADAVLEVGGGGR